MKPPAGSLVVLLHLLALGAREHCGATNRLCLGMLPPRHARSHKTQHTPSYPLLLRRLLLVLPHCLQVGSQVVLFGGEADNGPQSDVWLLGGFAAGETLRWTPLQLKASPAPRFGHAMAGTQHVALCVYRVCWRGSCLTSSGGGECLRGQVRLMLFGGGGAAAGGMKHHGGWRGGRNVETWGNQAHEVCV